VNEPKASEEVPSAPADASDEPEWLRAIAHLPERAPESLPPASFAPGERVGRFELIAEIGRGGFGTVFQARDAELGRRVAIKAMRGPLRDHAEAGWAARFQREAQAIARLNHPNIVTLHDFGVHRAVPFLVLELLEGETLEERIARRPLELAEALDVAAQVAGALVQAHAEGIVHRDLKPANVFVCRGGAVKVLDFGLARVRDALGGGEPDPALLSSLPAAGTRAYMSPEQRRGEAEDERTDVFAAGILLQSALGDLAPRAPEPVQALIRRATASARQDRFETSRLLFEALLAARRALEAGHLGRKKRTRLLALAIALCASVVALAISRSTFAPNVRAPASPAAQARRAIAVLGFKDVDQRPEGAWISTALIEMLNTELAAGEQVRTVEASRVASARAALGAASDRDDLDAAKLGERLGADYVLHGTVLRVPAAPEGPARIRVDLRLQDVRSGETIARFGDGAAESEIVDLARRAAAALRARLGVGALTSVQDRQARASLPASAEATRLYAQGLASRRELRYAEARALLEKAAAFEPGHAMTHEALADVLWALGFEKAARAQAKLALDLSEQRSPVERLLAEARYWETVGEATKAADIYRRLFDEHRDEAEYGFRLLRAQWLATDASAMRSTLDALEAGPAQVRDDARIFEGEARLAMVSGDRRGLPAAAQALIARGRAQHAPALVFEGLMFQGVEQWNRAEFELTVRSFGEAREIARRIGDRNGVFGATLALGDVQVDRGLLAEAQREYAAIEIADGEVRGARVGRLRGLGRVALLQGKLDEAKALVAAALEAGKDAEGYKYTSAQATSLLAAVARARGEDAEARRMTEEALTVHRALGMQTGVALSLASLGELLQSLGEFAEARERVGEALAIWQLRRAPVEIERCRLLLADLALDEGRAADAAAIAEAALAFFDKASLRDDAALSRAVLADARAAQGRFAQARAVAPPVESERLEVRLRALLSRARAFGDLQAARSALAAAERARLGPLARRARALLADLERRARADKYRAWRR
jgi:serine/threonine protein kinase